MQLLSLLQMIHIMLYFFVAAQGAFYLLGFHTTMAKTSPHDFMALRKIASPILDPRLKLGYLLALVYSIGTLLAFHYYWPMPAFFCALAATALLFADLILAVLLSLPLNKVIGRTHPGHERAAGLQEQWLLQIRARSFISVAGFALLLLAYIKQP